MDGNLVITTATKLTPNQHPKDRFFNPFRASKSTGAKEMVEDVLIQLQNYESHFKLRRRSRRREDQAIFEEAVAAVVCDLAHRFLEDPDGKIAIKLSNKSLGMKSRYRAPALSKVLPTILERLCSPELDFVQMTKGSRERIEPDNDEYSEFSVPQKPKWKGTATVIWPSKRLISLIDDLITGFDDFKLSESEELIILKDIKPETHPSVKKKSGKRLEYDDTEYTRSAREKLWEINEWLEKADIEVDQSFLKTPVNSHQRRLHRIFNNGTFDEGGRLWGGFWIPLNKDQRSDSIRIDGDPVCYLDYGQMGLRLLYSDVKATPPDGDLYEIPGIRKSRDGVKKLISSAISNYKEPKRMPKGVRPLMWDGDSYASYMKLINEYHHAVADHFYEGLSVALMRKESDVMVELLLELKRQHIVALPIHDGVLVADGVHEQTIEIMSAVFEMCVGVAGVVNIED
jgi:hypothetical protein